MYKTHLKYLYKLRSGYFSKQLLKIDSMRGEVCWTDYRI
jgi:hypothetical protein